MTSGTSDSGAAPAATARQRSRSPRGATTVQRGGAGSSHARASGITHAVLLATARAADGGPAAALPWDGGSVLRRLLEQIATLGIRDAHVLTRPEWVETLGPSADGLELSVELQAGADIAQDLAAVARLARSGEGGLVVACADIVTHREALAGLVADPRVALGILCTTRRVVGRPFAPRTRSVRGRVISAASPYHAVHGPNARFLGVLKVTAPHRAALAEVADQLAALTTPPLPSGWPEELESKEWTWRGHLASLALARARKQAEAARDGDASPELRVHEAELTAGDDESPGADDRAGTAEGLEEPAPESLALSAEDETELRRASAAAAEDAVSLLVVGLVRAGHHVGVSHLRKLFWARPLSRDATERAAEEITRYDEDRVLLDSAVKVSDGFFTTFFVSPYSKHLARWAARRGWTPNQVTTVSLAIGLLAAAAFATGERAGLVAGAVLLQLSFTTDCVDGQLARYTRTFSRLGAWLDSIFDRTKEYAAFAGLAIGASNSGDDVWLLAACALALQTARHAVDFSYPTVQHQMLGSARQPPIEEPGDGRGRVASVSEDLEPQAPRRAVPRAFAVWRMLDRRSAVRWLKKVIAFPIGERFAVVSLTAAFFTPRTTFVVLLTWGGIAACYIVGGRVLRSVLR